MRSNRPWLVERRSVVRRSFEEEERVSVDRRMIWILFLIALFFVGFLVYLDYLSIMDIQDRGVMGQEMKLYLGGPMAGSS